MAGFVRVGRRFGMWQVGAGLRYEHVAFDYLENGQLRYDMSRTYDNIFPSASVSTMIRSVQLALSYTHKTQRPSYSAPDGTIDYINRFTFEVGNPWLKPEKIHNVQLSGAWSRFFGQLAYTYKKDPVLNTTVPCGGNGENAHGSSSSYVNVKFYKAFFNNSFSVTLEANDIFNRNMRDFTFYSRDVTIAKSLRMTNRTFLLTLQYTFNVTRDRYKGRGAGSRELERF